MVLVIKLLLLAILAPNSPFCTFLSDAMAQTLQTTFFPMLADVSLGSTNKSHYRETGSEGAKGLPPFQLFAVSVIVTSAISNGP